MEAKYVPFSELLANVVDNRGRTCPTSKTGIPLVATNCIRNDLLYPAYEKVRYVSQETFRTWFRGHPRPGDFIFVMKGSPGRVCLAPDPVDFCIAQDMVAVRANEAKVDAKYLFALLRSDGVQQQIEQLHVGTLIPHFKKGDFDKLLLPIPDRSLQKVIGNIYFQLSRKIEMNRRMNETLEAIAQAVFKLWIVNSDRPASCPLDAIADFLNGLALQKFPPTGAGDLPVIKIAELRRGNTKGSDLASGCIPPECVVNDGDVLFSWSGTLEVAIWCGGKGALNQHLFKVTSHKYPKWFYYFWIKEHLEDFKATAASKATTMGHIQRHHLTEARVVVPSDAVLRAGNAMIAPMLKRMVCNNLESRTLAAIRDALLPKLMSGEIRVKQSEKPVEAHA